MNTQNTQPKGTETPEVSEFQVIVWLDKDTSEGHWLLGGQKEVRSIFFDNHADAENWLTQCVETNRSLSSLRDAKIHSRIVAR